MVEQDEGGTSARKMIDIKRLREIVPVSLRTIKRMENRGTFPAGYLVGGKKLWFEDDVARWQRNFDKRRSGADRPVAA